VTPTLTKPDEGDWLKAKISDGLIAQLAANSARRQSELPEFLTLSRTIDWTKSRQVRKEVSLSLDQRRTEAQGRPRIPRTGPPRADRLRQESPSRRAR